MKSKKLLLRRLFTGLLSCTLALCLLASSAVAEETISEATTEEVTVMGAKEDVALTGGEYVSFFLMCNEGMSNRGGNSGNTVMLVSMSEKTGVIRLMMLTWDTFVQYEGYDLPQRLDMAYRNSGPEESMKVFNANFNMDMDMFLSLNYLNLASLIDEYGGVKVNVSRAERNALNGMVSSKKENIQAMDDANLLDQIAAELLAKEYYLNDFGPETQLNGLQAVGYGWLRYDSVFNCCERELEVVSGLFKSVGEVLSEEMAFYMDNTEKPEISDGRRIINLDDVSEEDLQYILQAISPIFEMSYNNLREEDIVSITLALARISYFASRQGYDITEHIETTIMPLEAKEPYDIVAGTEGHLVDYEANRKAMREFLYHETF